ncbi:MAG: choice-of-anchor D domain-containing protein [Myxococcota bacterium]
MCTALLLASCSDGGGFDLGPEAQVDVAPPVVVFGDVPRGGEALRYVTIRHVGTNGVVELDPVELDTESADLTVAHVEKSSLAPGEETRIQILYHSGDDAPDEGRLVVGLNIGAVPEVVVPVSTPGQRGKLVARPATVDFGVVQAGAPKTVDVVVSNIGTAPATFTGADFPGDDDEDFSTSLPTGTVIDAGAEVTLPLTYSPSGGDSDDAEVVVRTDRDDVTLDIPVEGEEQTPRLVVEPNTVQFGWVEPGGQREITVKMRNEGNADLTITEATLEDAEDGVDLLTGGFETPVTLEPGDVEKIAAWFHPVEELPMGGDPIADLVIRSTDAAHDPMVVPLFGAAGVPDISVNPPDVVDFGFVAEGFSARRTVTVINIGDEAVTVEDAAFAEQTSEEFGLGNADELPAELNPGESVTLDLRFENTGGDKGTESARFFLYTTDKLVPEYPLDVVARRAERSTCEPAFVPDVLSMGAKRAGTTAEDTIQVVNFGSGECEYRDWDLVGCNKLQMGARHRYDCDPQQPGTAFSVSSEPPPGTILGPGESLSFGVRFDAPPIFNEELGRDQYFARLALFMHDPNLDMPVFVAPEGGWMKGINLRAESALPIVDVDPPQLEFGLVRRECASHNRNVTISNLGPMEAQVLDVEAEGCGDDVVITNLPPLPFTVDGFEQFALELVMVPKTPEDIGCKLFVETDAANLPVAEVSLTGGVIDDEHQIDEFQQVPTPKVDVLFVVDDSGSMTDEQLLLKQELPKLVDIAMDWGQDYHLGVTTTDTLLKVGRLQGSPPYVTPETEDAAEVFAEHLLVGINGYYEEMGLEGAWLALSGVNMASTDIACVDAPNACPSGFRCVDGKCRGPNWGFVRDDADLVIIIVSDEEDESPEAVDWYLDHFTALKEPQSGFGVKVHGIVTPAWGCPGYGTTGYRYINLVEQFHGHIASICATDFGAEFEAVGQKTFGLKDQFHPSLPVDQQTLEVRVNGEPCAEGDGWVWSDDTNAVIFLEDGACYPPFESDIEVEYDVLCKEPPE